MQAQETGIKEDKLRKSKKDRVIFGVCAGLGEYFAVDPVLIRIIFVVLAFMDGFGILLYLILAILMPEAENEKRSEDSSIEGRLQETGGSSMIEGEETEERYEIQNENNRSKRARWLGGALIIIGTLFLIDNLNLVWWLSLSVLWPLVIIAIGAWILIKRGA